MKCQISVEEAITTLDNGRHFIDLISKARVVWDKGRDIAIIIAENEFVTMYNEVTWSKIIRSTVSN